MDAVCLLARRLGLGVTAVAEELSTDCTTEFSKDTVAFVLDLDLGVEADLLDRGVEAGLLLDRGVEFVLLVDRGVLTDLLRPRDAGVTAGEECDDGFCWW